MAEEESDIIKEVEGILRQSKELSSREKVAILTRDLARKQLEALGYADILRSVLEYSAGENEVENLISILHAEDNNLPEVNPNSFFESIYRRMERIPDVRDKRALLSAAVFGRPFSDNSSGDIILTSYSVAERSNSVISREIDLSDKMYVANIVGTQQLLSELVGSSGFSDPDKPFPNIQRALKFKTQAIFTNTTNPKLEMRITRPTKIPTEGKSPNLWAHKVGVVLRAS